jgi:hypothetical protein
VCIIDIHNYARWTKGIIGQGGPTNAQFVNLWTQLATKYKGTANIAFGVMNEPHEVDIDKWADTVQQVVTAIRGAGATTQMSELLLSRMSVGVNKSNIELTIIQSSSQEMTTLPPGNSSPMAQAPPSLKSQTPTTRRLT